MKRAFFPIAYTASPSVIERIGPELNRAAILALRAILRNGRSLEVAHQQIRFAGLDLAFSSRISALGDLIVEFEIGDPRLANRVILEEDLRHAESKARRQRGHDKAKTRWAP
jgi:hypothetical protein